MGWFWADTSGDYDRVAFNDTQISAPGCPIRDHSSSFNIRPTETSTPVPSTGQGSCPYSGPSSPNNDPIPFATSPSSRLNPLNRMPVDISQSRSSNQTIDLPTDRSVSTIPKGHMNDEGNWVYPSPQQMYNALLRKGYTDTPQDAMEEMVAVHNFLNEGAWAEIVEWERRFSGGLAQGWRESRRGEAGSRAGANIGMGDADGQEGGAPVPQPRLLKFEGRPKEMTPKASLVQLMGWIYPTKFGCEPPFDRHDWYIQRPDPYNPSRSREVRYVIDYYSAPPEPAPSSPSSSLASSSGSAQDMTENEEDSQAVFYLDVRPAVDGPRAATERLLRWSGDVWWRASGGDATRQASSS